MRILSALIFILSATASMAGGAPYELTVELPSTSVKRLGDRFYLQLHLLVDKPYELQERTLPIAGRVGLHLRQDPAQVQRSWHWSRREYRLSMPFQVIGNEANASYVVVPPTVFNLVRAEQIYPVVIESFSVDIAAGVSLADRKAGDALALVDAHLPPLLPENRWKFAAVFFFLLMLAQFANRFFDLYLWPRWQRYMRPFARANRAIERLPIAALPREKALIVHAALNRSAGHTLLSCDLGAYLQNNPNFSDAEAALQAFFEFSDQLFFSLDSEENAQVDLACLVSLCADLEALQP